MGVVSEHSAKKTVFYHSSTCVEAPCQRLLVVSCIQSEMSYFRRSLSLWVLQLQAVQCHALILTNMFPPREDRVSISSQPGLLLASVLVSTLLSSFFHPCILCIVDMCSVTSGRTALVDNILQWSSAGRRSPDQVANTLTLLFFFHLS